MYLRQLIRDIVVHGRDHALQEIHIVCPWMYWQVVHKTFADQEVYRSVTMSPAQTEQFLVQQSRQSWLKKYKWGFSSKNFSMLIAYASKEEEAVPES